MAIAKNIKHFIEIVGESYAYQAGDKFDQYCQEPRGRFSGKPALILRPKDKEQISKIVKLAFETRSAIIPQGGNTGLVGGQQADHSGTEIILSLERLNKILELNKTSFYVKAQAGVTLACLQEAADQAARLFPLSLGSQTSCQLGGNLSTNAGGVAVLTYGNSRDLCLGLEVVLPNGEILDDLRKVRKDNSGYSLKDLFIGAEGSLGIITAATMKLFPKPTITHTAYLAFYHIEAILTFFETARERFGFALTAIEFLNGLSLQIAIDFAKKNSQKTQNSLFNKAYPYYILLELSAFSDEEGTQLGLESLLSNAFEKGEIGDAIIAKNEAERKIFWYLREMMSPAQKLLGESLKHDISVPLHNLPLFLEKANRLVEACFNEAFIVCFGHMGDGNLHYNISQPKYMPKEMFWHKTVSLQKNIYDLVDKLGGSFSAEHGIGQLKREEMRRYKSTACLTIMRNLKKTIDPRNIMNPGKILPDFLEK